MVVGVHLCLHLLQHQHRQHQLGGVTVAASEAGVVVVEVQKDDRTDGKAAGRWNKHYREPSQEVDSESESESSST